MAEKPKVRTGITPEVAEDALAWALSTRGYRSADMLALALTLWHLETGGGKSMYHYNYGNIVTSGPEYYLNGDTVHHYRIYTSALDGAKGLVDQLLSPTRPQWAESFKSGDAESFVAALGGLNGGPAWYEADPDRYREAFLSVYRQYNPKADRPTLPPQSSLSLPRLAFMPQLALGHSGVPVEVLQALLGGLQIDGQFGPLTERSVRRFQWGVNISPDGIVGTETWKALVRKGQ